MINNDSLLTGEFWNKKRLEDCPILDFHAHMWGYYEGYLPYNSPEEMLKSMDSCNVALACFCGHKSLGGIDKGNDIAVVSKYPERFKAYHIVLSQHLDVQADLERVENNPDVYVGFKFFCDYYKVPITDERHIPFFDYADKHGLMILSHAWGGSEYGGPDVTEKILDKYKNLVFIAGHSFFRDWEKAVTLIKNYPNIFLELTAVHSLRGPIDYFVEKVGSERILFGTDLPWFSYYNGIGAILSADMTDDDRRNIFYRNGRKLLSRFPWFSPLWGKCTPA